MTEEVPSKSRARNPVRRADYICLVLLLALLAWVGWLAQGLVRADFLAMEGRYRIQTWLDGKNWNAVEWVRLRDNLEAALAITPDNPNLHEVLGAFYGFRGSLGWRNDELRTMFFTEALKYQEASLRLRPGYAPALANRVLSQYALGLRGERLTDGLREALRMGPNEKPVQRIVSGIALAEWKEMPDDMRRDIVSIIRRSEGEQQKYLLAVAERNGVDLSTE